MAAMLRLQGRLLHEKRRQVEAAIQAVEQAERSIQSGRPLDWQALKTIIEVMEMQSNSEWTKKYYSSEAKAKLAERGRQLTPEGMAKAQQDWKELIAEVEAALARGEDPAGAKARGLAERWRTLIRAFTGGDPEVQKGLNKLYSDEANWPSNFKEPFTDDAVEFIRKAVAAQKLA
jgi:hypothetical protein